MQRNEYMHENLIPNLQQDEEKNKNRRKRCHGHSSYGFRWLVTGEGWLVYQDPKKKNNMPSFHLKGE